MEISYILMGYPELAGGPNNLKLKCFRILITMARHVITECMQLHKCSDKLPGINAMLSTEDSILAFALSKVKLQDQYK